MSLSKMHAESAVAAPGWKDGKRDARARAPYYAHALDLWPTEREDQTLLQLVLGMAEALGPGIGDFAAAVPYFKRATLLAERLSSINAQFNIAFQETMARFEQGTPATHYAQ